MTLFGKVMEILRKPVNLYSFVGLITVPSNQKTGHKKLINTTMFQQKSEQKTNIIWLMSTVMKCSSAYDISEKLKLHLLLLSQLVNAVLWWS
jgi:predicted transposase YdaD